MLLIDTHADELNHRLGHAQAALDLVDYLSRTLKGQKDIEAFVELAYRIRQAALAHALCVFHGAAGCSHVRFQRADEFIYILIRHIGADNKH